MGDMEVLKDEINELSDEDLETLKEFVDTLFDAREEERKR